jgi:hypothetical protein
MDEYPEGVNLENAEEIEVNEEGKIVSRGSGERKQGKGVQLPQHTFFAN